MPFTMDWTSDPHTVMIRLQLPDGVLDVEAPRKRLATGTIFLFVGWLVGTALLLFTIAALFMRNQVRAIHRLARAAEAFGMGRDVPPIRPEGAAEVRQAAAAFNRMQERIRRFLAQRTEMLAGVSHDLRTPLTRLRLTLAMLPRTEELHQDVSEMTADVEEMERMVGGYLSFARGEGTEQAEQVNLAEVLEDVAAGARRAGTNLAVDVPADLTLKLRANALRRAVTNLVDNARRHAVHVALAAVGRGVRCWSSSMMTGRDPARPARKCLSPVRERIGRWHRAWADDRPRHRPCAWWRNRAGGEPAWRPAGSYPVAGVAHRSAALSLAAIPVAA